MPTLQEVQTWRGKTAVDADGDKIGSIEDVYLDRQSGDPEWIAVKTGLFGSKVSFVPLRDAQISGDEVRIGHPKDLVKDAPKIDPDGEISPEEERALYQHYGRTDYDEWTDESEDRTARGDDGSFGDGRDAARHDLADADDMVAGERTAGRERFADDDRTASGSGAGDAMTRSEEELRVGTESRERGRARLRKYVTTEEQTRTVPVSRDEVRVEREPITDANADRALSGPEITESEHEVTLYEEEPVVEKRVEPKERVRLEKDVHTDERTVTDEVRKEHIESDGDFDERR
jgi:uncharacterized protein (TIGR02271 family)